MQFSCVQLRRFFVISVYFVGITYLWEPCDAQRTFLDKFVNEYRSFRGGLFNIIGRSDTESSYYWNLKRQVCLIHHDQ